MQGGSSWRFFSAFKVQYSFSFTSIDYTSFDTLSIAFFFNLF